MIRKSFWKTTGRVLLVASFIVGAMLPLIAVSADNSTQPNCLADNNCISESGSTTVYPVAQVTITRFPNTLAGTTFWVGQGGSGVGQSDVQKGLVDIGNSSSNCSTVAGAIYTCSQLDDIKFAEDAVSMVVNLSSGVCKLPYMTKWDIQGLYLYYSGENTVVGGATHERHVDIRYWDQFQAVADGAISCPHSLVDIYARETTSGTEASLLSLNGISAAQEAAAMAAKGKPRVTGNPGMQAAVDGDAQGIGYVGLHFVGLNDTALSLESDSYGKTTTYPTIVPPSDANVVNGTYPMGRFLHMFVVDPAYKTEKSNVAQYLAWILKPEAQSIVRDEAYIPVAPTIGDTDVNMDGITDIGDVGVVGIDWGKTNSVPGWIRSDVNYDGVVDIGDIGVIGLNWEQASAGK